MSEMEIVVETTATGMPDLKDALDQALQKQFPGGMMKRRWEGEVLHLQGPGAEGTVVHEGGRLVGRATLKPPASMMKPVIEEKVTKAMTQAVAQHSA